MTLARAITPWAEPHQLKIMKLSQMFRVKTENGES